MSHPALLPPDPDPHEPPWSHAPGLHHDDGRWRQGSLETYRWRWFRWVESMPRDEALAYLRTLNPPEEGYWALEHARYLKHLEEIDWAALQAKNAAGQARQSAARHPLPLWRRWCKSVFGNQSR